MTVLFVLLRDSRTNQGALLGDDCALLRCRLARANAANQVPQLDHTLYLWGLISSLLKREKIGLFGIMVSFEWQFWV